MSDDKPTAALNLSENEAVCLLAAALMGLHRLANQEEPDLVSALDKLDVVYRGLLSNRLMGKRGG